ncbi:MAG TPA: HAD family phosphatase [Pseudonocardiaceae bacterium]|nr:HAD family phosphatase [Pseudonocardiaceae bacterium]
MEERAIDAVVFDYGGVLTTPVRHAMTGWLAEDGVTEDSYRAVMREWLVGEAAAGSPIHRLETGELSPADFEATLAPRLVTTTGVPVVADGLLGRMFALMRPDPAMLALVTALRSAGLRTALLSNSWGDHYADELLALFDVVVISGRVGLRKPDPAVFGLLLERLGLPAERVAFVDDIPANIRAARELGIHAVQHTDTATTTAQLRRLVPDLPESGPGARDVTA